MPKAIQALPKNLNEAELRTRICALFNEHIIPILENFPAEDLRSWARYPRTHEIRVMPEETHACHEIWIHVPEEIPQSASQRLKDYFLPCLADGESLRVILNTGNPKIILYTNKPEGAWDPRPIHPATRLALETFLSQTQAEAQRLVGISGANIEEPTETPAPPPAHQDTESEFQTAS
jgi:hypothetical protein